MQMGMVDRGADLSWLSQYPHEREVLLPPLTGVEAFDTEVEGGTLVVHARLSLNLNGGTLEQVLSRRRRMLMDMIEGFELEVRDALSQDADKEGGRRVLLNKEGQLAEVGVAVLRQGLAHGPLSHEHGPEWFNSDDNYATAVQQSLDLQLDVVPFVLSLAGLSASQPLPARAAPGLNDLDSKQLQLRGWASRRPGRLLLVSGWVHHASSSKDGPDVSVDLREAELNTSEAEALASLMHRCPRLTTVDVRGNNSMGAEGVAALRHALRGLCAADGKPRSLCGLAPDKSMLTVPKEMPTFEAMLFVCELESATFAESQGAQMGIKNAKETVLHRRQTSAVTGEVWSPLLWAVKDNNAVLVRQLIADGYDPNTLDSKLFQEYSALHWAAMRGHREAAAVLLEAGADTSLRDLRGHTARQLAEKNKDKQFLALYDRYAFGVKDVSRTASASAVVPTARTLSNNRSEGGSPSAVRSYSTGNRAGEDRRSV